MSAIERLDLGHIAAEFERQLLVDRGAFIGTPQFQTLLTANQQLFVGRKGDGKTALRYAFLKHSSRSTALTVDLSFTALSSELFFACVEKCHRSSGIEMTRLLRNMWRFLIGIRLMNRVRSSGKLWPEFRVTEIEAILDVLDELDPSLLEAQSEATALLHVAQHCADSIETFIANHSRAAVVDQFPIGPGFKNAETQLASVLGRCGGATVIVDDLDPWMEAVDAKLASAFVVSIISAAGDLEEAYPSGALRLRLLLPERAFRHAAMSYLHWDKVARGFCRLSWNGSLLRQLIARRIAIGLNIRRHGRWSENTDLLISRVFPNDLVIHDYWARPRSPFEYILFHSQLTPRDVIYCCNAIIEAVRSDGIDHVTADIIRSGVRANCRHSVERTLGECTIQFPEARDVMQLFSNKPAKFKYDEASKWIADAGVYKGDPAQSLTLLYEMGFCGKFVRHQSRHRIGPAERWPVHYYHADPDPGLRPGDRLVVHPMFWESYSLSWPEEAIGVAGPIS